MKLTINRNTMAEALQAVMPFVTTKSPIAILKYAKCTTKGKRMKIEANDTQGGIVRYMELIDCDADGSFLVNAADMFRLVSKITAPEINIEAEGESLSMTYGKASADFSVPAADDYPSFSVNDDESTTLTVPAVWISSCIAIGQDFVMDDNLKPQLCAIYCYVKDGRFGFCATDTRSLATDSWEMPGCDADGAFLIMRNVFGPLRMMCAKNDNGVTVTFNDKHVTYRCGDTIIQSVQASGRYPDFNRVIPKTHNVECKAAKSAILEPLSRVAMFCEVSKCVQFAFSPFDVTMTVENLTDGKRSVEHADVAECTGELTIGINADNIIKCLKAYGSSDIVMEMTDPGRPIVVRSDDNPNMTVLSMPMQILG